MTGKKLILLKGNPKFYIPGISENFYKKIHDIFKDYTIVEIESDVRSDKIPSTKSGDIILGFSRGCGFWRWLRMRGEPALMVGIGCGKDQVRPDISLQNPKDDGSKTRPADIAHWTITLEMEKKLKEIAKGKR